jgi:general stress protein 26
MTTDQKATIFNFLKNTKIAVMATHSNDRPYPESAVITLSETPDLHIIINSSKYSRKNKNILENNKVSVAVGFDWNTMQTVQIEGNAHILTDEGRISQIIDHHFDRNPHLLGYRGKEDREFIEVVPKWIRYNDIAKGELWEVEV